MVLLISPFTMAGEAQEALWKELIAKSNTLLHQGEYSEAAKVAEEALIVAEKTFRPDHPQVVIYLNNLAAVYQAQGRYAEAGPLYKRSLKIVEKALGPDHPDLAFVLENMAECCRKMGKEDEAKKLEARAKKIKSNQ